MPEAMLFCLSHLQCVPEPLFRSWNERRPLCSLRWNVARTVGFHDRDIVAKVRGRFRRSVITVATFDCSRPLERTNKDKENGELNY